MVMVEAREGTANHAITKMPRPIERGNVARQILSDAEVASAPRNLIVEFEKSRSATAYCPLARRSGRANMGVDAASEIKAPFTRGSDLESEFYPSHGDCAPTFVSRSVSRNQTRGRGDEFGSRPLTSYSMASFGSAAKKISRTSTGPRKTAAPFRAHAITSSISAASNR